jgi:trk system potassium uptake protein TrkA
MNVIVVGCGRVGAELAYGLYQRHHHVTIIDELPQAFENLPPDFRGRTVEGEVLSPDVLHRAGIENAQGLAAVTSSDSLNAVVAHLASTVYHVHNVVVRSYIPHQRPLLEAFGLQVVSPSTWGAQRIGDLLAGFKDEPVLSLGNGEVEVHCFAIPATWERRRASELNVDGQRVLVGLMRTGRAILPGQATLLEPGDVVYVSATAEGVASLRQLLGLKED